MPNTTDVEKVTAPCPSWCKCRDCDGEHGYTPDRYTPASASLPLEVNAVRGAMFPAVGVSLFRDDIGAGPARIALHIVGGEHLDDQYDFTLEEGLQFAGDFLATYLMAVDDLPRRPRPSGDFELLRQTVDSLAKAMGHAVDRIEQEPEPRP